MQYNGASDKTEFAVGKRGIYMNQEFYLKNRQRFYQKMENNSLLVLGGCTGQEV